MDINRSTIIGALLGLAIGLGIGVFFLSSGTETAVLKGEGGSGISKEDGGETVRWKMASSLASTLPVAGTGGKYVEERVRVLSEGKIELKFYDPNSLVPPLEVFDSVSAGSVNAGWTNPGFWAGKVPALQFFASVPFGARAGET